MYLLSSDAADRCCAVLCTCEESKHHQKLMSNRWQKKQSVTIDRWQRHSSPTLSTQRQNSTPQYCVSLSGLWHSGSASALHAESPGFDSPQLQSPLHSCPSGPRSSTQVRVCSHSWVQIPPNAFLFCIRRLLLLTVTTTLCKCLPPCIQFQMIIDSC